jgi:hypothetical protein
MAELMPVAFPDYNEELDAQVVPIAQKLPSWPPFMQQNLLFAGGHAWS